MDTLASEIKDFIVSNFLFGQSGDALKDDQSFLETGVIDSTGLLELVSFVEERYGISVGDKELVPENLDSLRNISQFVARKREAAAAGAAN
ncbi:MAG: acyl carrier protein [Vicinamibacterales bacterium]